MKLSDLGRVVFKTASFGYRPKEVDRYIHRLTEGIEEILRENLELKQMVGVREEEIAEMKRGEGPLTDTLAVVQNTIDRMKETAMKEGELVIYQSGIQSEEILRSAEKVVMRLQQEASDLRRQREGTTEEIKMMMQGCERVFYVGKRWEMKNENYTSRYSSDDVSDTFPRLLSE